MAENQRLGVQAYCIQRCAWVSALVALLTTYGAWDALIKALLMDTSLLLLVIIVKKIGVQSVIEVNDDQL